MRLRAGILLLSAALGCGDAVATPIRAAQSRADAAAEDGRGSGIGAGADVPDLAHCADAADWPVELAAAELQLFAAINAARAEGIRCGDDEEREREPLVLVPELRCSARLHSLDMYENDYVGRENGDGDDFRDRIRATGLDARAMDESIERSDDEPAQLLEHLLEDWDDCGNLINPELDGVGIGHYADLWTLDFADTRANADTERDER
ncbi:MAG TPA: hypothetical protein VK509_08425 [Polyangiales bacterium]|nr:hypothetical protein [Polyangiales bacterium]